MKRIGLRERWKEGQLKIKSDGMARTGRGQDKLEGRMDDKRIGRAGRKPAHGGWFNRVLGKEKDRDQNMTTVKSEGSR